MPPGRRAGPSLADATMRMSEGGFVGSLPGMENKKKKASVITRTWRLALVLIGVVAVAQELRKAPEERTWQGKVADLVPYDFRRPTFDRLRSTYWNPEGPILPGKVFGVGWAVNLGALTRLASAARPKR